MGKLTVRIPLKTIALDVLPNGAQFVRGKWDDKTDALLLVYEHDEWPQTAPGDPYPVIDASGDPPEVKTTKRSKKDGK